MTVLIMLQYSRRCTAFYLHNLHLRSTLLCMHQPCIEPVCDWCVPGCVLPGIILRRLGRTRQLLCDWSPCDALPLSNYLGSSSHGESLAIQQNRPRGNSQLEATPVLVMIAQQTWSTMAPQRAARHVANDASNATRTGQAVVNASGCDGCVEVTNQRKRQAGFSSSSRTRALVQGSFRRHHGPGALAC